MGMLLNTIANNFNVAILNDSIIEAELEYDELKKDLDIDKPEKFLSEKWKQWEESVHNYSMAEKNSLDIPYAYVIRMDPNPTPPDKMEDVDHIIFNVSLTWALFERDLRKVLSILCKVTLGTQAETWMKGKGVEGLQCLLYKHIMTEKRSLIAGSQ